ncbi:MAG TPA: efflux transporter outer membrane subunit [Janthinobacterium sp.]|nr:efflux transporter outer membrane subunit [Janthinobacterium sp.]
MRAQPFALSALTAAAMLAGGCSLQPVYERPAAPVAAAFPSGPAYKDLAGNGRAAADTGWRDFLRDARLQKLVELALQNNRDLRVAVLNVQKVQAQYRIVRAAQLPQVSLGAGATRQGPNALGGSSTNIQRNYSADLQASWELDFFGRLSSLTDAALDQYLATAYARQATQLLLVAQVAEQYLLTLADDEQLIVTQQTLDTASASYNIIKLQFDTGTASELDLRLAQTTLELAQANRAAQLRARAQAENALVLLVGQPLPAGLPPPLRLGEQAILADIPAGLPSDLLARRPDIQQAEAMLRSENADIGAARANFFPRITLTGLLGSAAPTLGGLFDPGTKVWSFAPSLVAPVFDGGANRANLDAAKLQKDIGVAQYEKAIQVAFREVSDGLAARGTYDEELAALTRYTEAQQRRLDLASLLYKNGVDDYLAVLTAQTDLYNAQLSLVSARLNRLANLVDLYRALGGGWIERNGEQPRPADAPADAPMKATAQAAKNPAA